MTDVEALKKKVAELEQIATRQANALQAYLLMVHSKKMDGAVAVDLYIANHEALKYLGLPVLTGVKQ